MSKVTEFFKKDVFTFDNVLHTILFVALVALAYWSPILTAVVGLYLREQGQAKSWTLKFSVHKWMEVIIPSSWGYFSILLLFAIIVRWNL